MEQRSSTRFSTIYLYFRGLFNKDRESFRFYNPASMTDLQLVNAIFFRQTKEKKKKWDKGL